MTTDGSYIPEVEGSMTNNTMTSLTSVSYLNDVTNNSETQMNITNNEEWILQQVTDAKIALFLPAVIYVGILIVTGTFGNSIVLYVYWTNWISSTARVFILSLAMIDMVNCLVTLPMELVVMYNPVMFDHAGLCKLFRFTTYTMNSSSACILIAIGYDVCHRIKRPMKRHMTTGRAKLASVICIIVGVGVSWPSLVIYGTDRNELITPEGNVTLMPCLFDENMKRTPFPKIFFILLFLSTIIGLIVLCAMYGIIGVSLCRQFSMWERSGSSRHWSSSSDTDRNTGLDKNFNQEKEVSIKNKKKFDSLPQESPSLSRNGSVRSMRSSFLNKTISRMSFKMPKFSGGKKTTKMLFVIAVIYIISFLPFLTLAVLRTVKPGLEDSFERNGQMVYYVAIRSYLMNSATNPIVYSLCNSRFRRKCFKIFSR